MNDPMARVFEWPNDGKKHWGKPNPEYEPAECGLELLATLECGGSYEFDTTHLWRDIATGKFFVAHDEGCSCPTPFEGFNSLSAMTEVSSAEDVKCFLDAYKGSWALLSVQGFIVEATKHFGG